MILPEDPEKEALQRQLDAEDEAQAQAQTQVEAQARGQGRTRALTTSPGEDQDQDQDQDQSRTSFTSQNLDGYTGLALPPPPYNPGLVHRGTNPYSFSPASTPPPPPLPPTSVFRGTYTYPRSFTQVEAEASGSQITLPSSSDPSGNPTRERFEVDDSSIRTSTATGVNARRKGRRRFFGFSSSLPDVTGVSDQREGSTSYPREVRRDKGKRREQSHSHNQSQIRTSDERRGGIKGLLDLHGWAWDTDRGGNWDVRRWGMKRWIWGVVFVVVLASGIAGGLVGGLSLGRQNENTSKIYTAGGSRVVVPFDAKGYLTFDPMKNGPPVEDGTSSRCNLFSPLDSSNILRSVAFAPYGQTITYATFYLDKNASTLFVRSKGDSSSGSVQVMGTDDYPVLQAGEIPQDKVRIDVVKRTGANATESLVCRMTDETGRQGVGVYTQSLSTDSPDEVVAGDPQLSFFILVRFPPPASMPMSSDGEVNSTAVYDQLDRKLNSFEIVTDQMGLRMGNMKGLASFDSLNVSIGRGLIGADYVAADSMVLQTRTSSLWGTFNVSESLLMNSTNGGLLADVILHNPGYPESVTRDGSGYFPRAGLTRSSLDMRALHESPPTVNMVSSRAIPEYDPVPLDVNPDEVPIRNIKVRAQTTDGPLVLKYLAQPPGVVLDSGAYTSNGEASTRMHPAFQGGFLLRSVNGDLRIPESNDLEPSDNGILNFEDPWAEDRRRVIVFDQGNNTAFGENLTSTVDDSLSPWGFTRGDSVYNKDAGSFQVAGVTMWLTTEEVAETVNISSKAMAVAKECANQTCSGYAAMRNSKSVTQTSWGGGELTFS